MKKFTILSSVIGIFSTLSYDVGRAPGVEANLCWSQELRVERPAGATLVFSWRQRFDIGREGDNWTFKDRPTIHLTIARLALQIDDQWYVSHRVSSVYQEQSGVWEQKTFVLGRDKRWVKVFGAGTLKRARQAAPGMPPGATVSVGLPSGTITSVGIYNDEMVGEHRIDKFQVRPIYWQPATPQPDRPGTWPQYKRNAARQGDAPDERLALPLARVAAFRFPTPIYASPAVANGHVFIQDAAGHVACLDHKAKRVVWVTNIGGVANHSSPAVANGRVFIGSTAGYLAILDATNGKLLKRVPGPGGVISSPAVEGSAVYFSPFKGNLIKIDFDGNAIWTYAPGLTSITEFAVHGNEILFYGGRVTAHPDLDRLIDLGDESLLAGSWGGHCPSGGPVFGPGGTAMGQAYDSEMGTTRLFSWSGSGEVKPWIYNDLSDSRSTPSVRGDRYYRGDKCFALNGSDKGQATVLWQADPETTSIRAGGFNSSPALSEQYQVLGGEDGRVSFFRLDPKVDETGPPVFGWGIGGRGRAKVPVNKPVWSFATEGAGKPNGAVSSSPALADGRVFFGGEDGVLYVLGSGKESPIVDLPVNDEPLPSHVSPTRTNDLEWHTAGGDMGYNFVSPDQTLRPPLRIKWKTRVWGSFKSNLVIADGLVFGANRLGQLAALDAETGRIVWRTAHPRTESRPGPTYVDGKLLIIRGSLNQHGERNAGGGLWCHDAKTGHVLWQRSVPFAYHGNVGGVVVHEGKVLVAVNGGDGAVLATAYSLGNGTEVWNRRYEGLIAEKSLRPVRVTSVMGDGRWYLSVPDRGRGDVKRTGGGTLAVDPNNGELIWENHDYRIFLRSRIAFRDGLLVVFTKDAAEALDAATGKHLWTGHGRDQSAHYARIYYQQPLTDLYLESKGTRGICASNECSHSVFVNGVWYGHLRAKPLRRGKTLRSGPVTALAGRVPGEMPDPYGVTVNRTIWMHKFLSNACPVPSPAYGRLYYAPNGEGMVYCFEPDSE